MVPVDEMARAVPRLNVEDEIVPMVIEEVVIQPGLVSTPVLEIVPVAEMESPAPKGKVLEVTPPIVILLMPPQVLVETTPALLTTKHGLPAEAKPEIERVVAVAFPETRKLPIT